MAKKKIGKIVFLIVICLFLAVQLYPVLWLFLASIKPTTELSAAPFALPKSPTLANYIKIFSDGKILDTCGAALRSRRFPLSSLYS